MKIGLNGYAFGSTKDRVSQYATFCIRALVEGNPSHEFVLYVPRKITDVLPKNCTVVVLVASSAESRKNWERKVESDDAFESLDFFHSFQDSWIQSSKVPFGITFHSTLILKPKRFIWQTWLHRKRINRSVKKAKLIITVTDVLRKEISHAFSLPLDHIRVVPGAADVYFQKTPELAAIQEAQKNVSKGHDFLMYVGKVRKSSHIRDVLASFSQMLSEPRFAKLKLVITGRIPYHRDPLYLSQGDLQKIVQGLGMRGSVLFSGPLKREQLRALYKLARGIVCDTTDLGFPVVAFEAALSGTAMLLPNTQPYSEFFTGEYLRYDTKNPKSLRLALSLLADTSVSKTDQVVKAQIAAHSYSWNEAAHSLMRAVTEVVEKKSRNR